jgi:excisionase family DNA binding protein
MSPSKLPSWIPNRLLTVPEVAELLRLSQRQVRRLISDDRLGVTRIGRRVLVRPESILSLLESK